MTENESTTVDEIKIKQWIINNSTLKEIEAELLSSGFRQDSIETTIRAYKKIKNSGKHSIGITCLIAGAVIGFSGFILALLNPIPALFHFFLYGLTPVAIIILFVGLYFLFE